MSDLAEQIQVVARQATANRADLDAGRKIADAALRKASEHDAQIADLRVRFSLMSAASQTGIEVHSDRLDRIEARFADIAKEAADAKLGIAHLRGLGEGRELTGRHVAIQASEEERTEARRTLRSVLDSHGKTVQIVLTLLGLLAIVVNYLLDRLSP